MSDDDLKARLIVTDTGPLITLAAAECLEYLLYPDAPVYIPDAVLYEATVKSSALGAESISAWVQAHPDRVFPIVTGDCATIRGLPANPCRPGEEAR